MKRLILLLLITTAIYADSPTMPSEWRIPSESELGDNWREGIHKNAAVVGDFNGDGLNDGAYLVVSSDGQWEGLLAFISLEDKVRWYELSKSKFDVKVFMGLDWYSPGRYKVLCETDAECEESLKKEIAIETDAFAFYRPGSASSIFVWNMEDAEFDRIWESD